MLQKAICGYTMSISKFKTNPSAAMSEAQGEPIAITSNNKVQFYAVPAELFEDMVAFCEYSQRGTIEQVNIPSRFTGEGVDMNALTERMAVKLKGGGD